MGSHDLARAAQHRSIKICNEGLLHVSLLIATYRRVDDRILVNILQQYIIHLRSARISQVQQG